MRLLHFETASCPKCTLVSNFLTQKNVRFEVVDAEKRQAIAASFQVMAVPATVLLDNDNKEVMRSTGANPVELTQIIHTFQKGESSYV